MLCQGIRANRLLCSPPYFRPSACCKIMVHGQRNQHVLLTDRWTWLPGRASAGSQGWSQPHLFKSTMFYSILPMCSSSTSSASFALKARFSPCILIPATIVAPYKLISFFIVQTDIVCLDCNSWWTCDMHRRPASHAFGTRSAKGSGLHVMLCTKWLRDAYECEWIQADQFLCSLKCKVLCKVSSV